QLDGDGALDGAALGAGAAERPLPGETELGPHPHGHSGHGSGDTLRDTEGLGSLGHDGRLGGGHANAADALLRNDEPLAQGEDSDAAARRLTGLSTRGIESLEREPTAGSGSGSRSGLHRSRGTWLLLFPKEAKERTAADCGLGAHGCASLATPGGGVSCAPIGASGS